MPRVSILDLSPVAAGSSESQALLDTIEMARHADRLGYHRFWLAEHHGGAMVASSSPELMIGAVAGATERIRVGSGGVMLPNHSPLRVAEQFKVLAALHPGRIDLGIGRAPGTDQVTAVALRRSRDAPGGEDLPTQLGELLAFAGERPWPEGHPFSHVRAAPFEAPLPPIYLLGSSDYSAQLAAAAGLGFAFAAHINPDIAVDALRLYRERFVASADVGLDEPYAILAHAVVCAETDERARDLAAPARVAFRRLRSGAPTPLPSVADAVAEEGPQRPPAPGRSERMLVGSAVAVRERADDLLTRSGADELMAMTNVHDLGDRVRSAELLAEAFGLEASEAAEPAGATPPA
jgi:luciferase family oxidoreductase group 1